MRTSVLGWSTHLHGHFELQYTYVRGHRKIRSPVFCIRILHDEVDFCVFCDPICVSVTVAVPTAGLIERFIVVWRYRTQQAGDAAKLAPPCFCWMESDESLCFHWARQLSSLTQAR